MCDPDSFVRLSDFLGRLNLPFAVLIVTLLVTLRFLER